MAERCRRKARSGRAKRWTEAEAREALQEFRESRLSAVVFAAKRGISLTRLPYWAERLGTRSTEGVNFVAVPLPSQHRVGLEYQGVTARVGVLGVEELAQLVIAIARRAPGC